MKQTCYLLFIFVFSISCNQKSENTEIVSTYIRCMFQDKDGNIWFGTQEDGVCRYNPAEEIKTGKRTITFFGENEGLSSNTVRVILQDSVGNMWFGTDRGICSYDKQSFKRFFSPENTITANDNVWSGCIDTSGGIWFGTQKGTVLRYNPQGSNGPFFSRFNFPEVAFDRNAETLRGSPYASANDLRNSISCITEDHSGNIWFGRTVGAWCYNPSAGFLTDSIAFKSFTKKDGLSDDNISSIIEDKKGNIWFGMRDGGASAYDGKTFTNFSAEDVMSEQGVWRMFEDKNGNIWFGNIGGGATCYDGKTFTNFSPKDGLTTGHVQSFLEDKEGNLWLGTSAGVFRYDPAAKKPFSDFLWAGE